MITLIWCEDKEGGIGCKNNIPWSIKEEMNHFREKTLNKIIVMGKNTYNSIGKPLNNRTNIVISKSLINEKKYSNLIIFKNIAEFLSAYKNKDFFVIGGLSIYKQFIPFATNLIISRLNEKYCCDLFTDEIKLNNFEIEKIENHISFKVFYYKKII